MSEKHPTTEETLKRASNRILDATSRTFHQATHKATQYKTIVQKRIDIGSLHRRINHLHHDLGMTLDNLMQDNAENALDNPELQGILAQLNDMRTQMHELEVEVEQLRHPEVNERSQDETEPPQHH